MRFCPWYPLADAPAHAPAGEGVLQLRLATGLIDYPTGKSAMVHYEHAADVCARASQLARELAGRDLLCRHLEPSDGDQPGARSAGHDPAQFHAKVRADFVRRFGAPPALP